MTADSMNAQASVSREAFNLPALLVIMDGFGLAEERILLRTVIFSKKRVQTDDIFKIGQIPAGITNVPSTLYSLF